jgi:hypothetical protein
MTSFICIIKTIESFRLTYTSLDLHTPPTYLDRKGHVIWYFGKVFWFDFESYIESNFDSIVCNWALCFEKGAG